MSEEVQNIMKANLGNYKGVMLCNRPGDDMKNQGEKPFISRVNPKDNWGLLPEKKREELQVQTSTGPTTTLQKHKQWLTQLKKQVQDKKYLQDNDHLIQQQKFNRIREIGIRNRETTKRIKQQYQELRNKVMQDMDQKSQNTNKQVGGLNKENLDKMENKENKDKMENKENNKKQKKQPAWAKTQEKQEQEESEECDELLDFVDNLDYDKYIDDMEVQNMLTSLKDRIEGLKQEIGEQGEENVDQVKQEEKNVKTYFQDKEGDKEEDKNTIVSKESQRSVLTVRLQAEQKLKKEAKQWDSTSYKSKQSAGFQDRVAKKVADEILLQYKNLKSVHSNNSIRKILEQEALKCLNNNYGVNQPQITKIKDPSLVQINVNPSTLPYLHRNPAI